MNTETLETVTFHQRYESVLHLSWHYSNYLSENKRLSACIYAFMDLPLKNECNILADIFTSCSVNLQMSFSPQSAWLAVFTLASKFTAGKQVPMVSSGPRPIALST